MFIVGECINMSEQVTSACQTACNHPKSIHRLKAFLTQEAFVNVVYAYVTSRIDYCTSLYLVISDYNTTRLQIIHNAIAYTVTNTRKY